MNKQQWQSRVDALEKEIIEREKELEDLKANPPKREPGERWKPGRGGTYWIVDIDGAADDFTWRSDDYDGRTFNSFNVFETKEEAEFQAERTQVMRELDLWAVDSVMATNKKYYIYYHFSCHRILISSTISYTHPYHVFESEEIAKKAIKAIGEERLKKYYFRVGD